MLHFLHQFYYRAMSLMTLTMQNYYIFRNTHSIKSVFFVQLSFIILVIYAQRRNFVAE